MVIIHNIHVPKINKTETLPELKKRKVWGEGNKKIGQTMGVK